jgi:hypothetical protein
MSPYPGVSYTVEQSRDKLRQRRECTFVERHEFCCLLVSRRTLVRANEWAADVYGVFEPQTGLRFLVERERLLPSGSYVGRGFTPAE